MGTFTDWIEFKNPKPKHDGGFHPKNEEELKKFKHADLIVLPPDVRGTNCGNCKYGDGNEGVLYCKHHDIEMNVTSRMCCKYWDNKGVKREWKPES